MLGAPPTLCCLIPTTTQGGRNYLRFAGYSARLVVTAPSFLRRSSFWRTLTCARSPGQIFRSQFLSWNLPVVSLTIRPKLGGFRRKTTQVTCRSHHVRSKARTVTWFATADVHFNPLVEEVFVRLLLCEVTHFPPFFFFFPESSVQSPQLRSGELCFLSLRVGCLHKLFEIFNK